ncbi:hypothetical protein PybrP1_003130 [[Pythium] brassicae (nom. inval.)]|nr:hypothetical protein PybrP1_003130 [[Pythium] brassicae (nom. inval.)]
MCGRARCTLAREQAAQAAGVPNDAFVNGDKYAPVENMGPGRYAPVVLGGGAQHARRLEAMQWGLVPAFTKPSATPDHFVMFNARSDTVQERPAFRRLVDSRRCVVLCDGYYEWQQVDKREKQPYYFFRDTGVMTFAGLYDTWTNNDGVEMHSFTILTTDATPHLRWLHTRMPVILTEEGVTRWTSDAKFAQVKDLLVPYTAPDLKWHPVDKRLGSTKFQSEDCAKKVDIKHAGDIKAFFAVRQRQQQIPSSRDADADNASGGIKASSSATGFVPASSLLGKRAAASPVRGKSTATAWSSPPRPSPSKKPKAAMKDPKQGTMLAFLQPKRS